MTRKRIRINCICSWKMKAFLLQNTELQIVKFYFYYSQKRHHSWYSLHLHYFMIPDMISRQAENHLPYSSIRIHRDWASHCTHCSSPVHNQPKVSENSKDYYSNGGWGIGGQVLVLVLSFNSVPLGYALTSPFRRYNELWWNGELWRAM